VKKNLRKEMNEKKFKRGDIIHNPNTSETLIFRNDYAIPSPNLCGINCKGVGVLRNTLQDYRFATEKEAETFTTSLKESGWKWEGAGLVRV
jgi:hypothetical protein